MSAEPAARLGGITDLRRLLPKGAGFAPDVWQARHRGVLILLWAHAAAIPAFGLIRGFDVPHVVLESSIVPILTLLASWSTLGRRAQTGAASAALLSSSAILVHLSGGVIEMHFHFFVMVAVVALYQDWLPFLAAIGYVLVHHGLLGALDPNSVYNHVAAQNGPWKWAAIHAFFIAGTSAACVVTWRLNESILEQRLRAEAENARLYEAEREARRSVEAAQARLSLLADASQVLTTSLEVDVILRGLTELVIPTIADYCAIDLSDEEGSVRRVIEAGTQPPGAEVIELALVGRRQVLGAFRLATDAPGGLHDACDRPLAEELARRVAVAIENARLYARQRSVAITLQHALLPDRLPQIPGLDAAARYLAGGPDVEVGGDWYELVQLPDGSIAVAIGDVVGRGERAASLMGQLRTAVRVSALDGKAPREVLATLNELLLEAGRDHLATVLYGVLSPETSELRFVSAGHPPPLLIKADRTAAVFLEGTGGIPIGALSTARYVESRATIEPGATLLLYTDGLIEERTRSLDVGLERLRAAAASAPEDLERLCTHVIEHQLGSVSVDDDVAVLAVRVQPLGERLRLSLPATMSILAPLRATLRRWLVQAGADEQECFELLVALGEACSNAIRHGSPRPGAHFEIDGTADGEVTVRVRDRGRWRAPGARAGGRGLPIIESLVDDLEIVRGAGGTEVCLRRRLGRPKRLPSAS